MAAKNSSSTEGGTEAPKRRTRRRKKATNDQESVDKAADVATKTAEPPEPISGGEQSGEAVAEGSRGGGEKSSGEGGESDGRRRKRRRRRRKGGEEGGSNSSRNERSSNRNGGGNSNNSNSGNRRSRGRRNKKPGGGGGQGGGGGGPEDNVITGNVTGVLELHPKGYGFIRSPENNYSSESSDAFVPSSLIEKHRLREGIMITGGVGPGSRGQGPRLKSIETIDGNTLDEYLAIKNFDELTAINPHEQIVLETGPKPVTMRVMDLLTPIGKGQRALIVAPPRTGKTMLLQQIANSVSTNHPDVKLIVLLIDERPEEVTEMRRQVNGEVIASSMDRDVESHVRISQLIIERGKRLAESGKDVFILLDSITRTARAFNKWGGNTGRTMTGGLDVKALDIPKKMFGTARCFDEGGSLTVVGTALIETGSRMDEVIFQEFKGTGNMELVLNRRLAERRIWPAIDIGLSGTRREEMILSEENLEGVILLRRSLVSLEPIEAMEQLIKTLERFPSNAEFLTKIRSIM